jgi:hypothetical protein
MRLRHRTRPHSGPQRHLNPPYGTNRRHGGRLHLKAEGHEAHERHDRKSRKRQMGGSTGTPGTTSGMTPAQMQMLQQQTAMNPPPAPTTPYNPTAVKRGGRVHKRAHGGRMEHEEEADRKSGGGKWMQKAFANAHGQFKAKAARAGMSTKAFANKVTKEGSKASTKTKRQANLAKLGARFGGHHH